MWRRKRVHLFNISTSKSGPSTWCLSHFDLEICFVPQWRALLSISTDKNSFNMFIAKPSRHNAVHLLNISPSKSGSSMCSHHFDMELRFPPHQLKLFPHLTCQGCSGREVCSFFDFKTCFPPQRRAIVHLLCGEMAPQPPF